MPEGPARSEPSIQFTTIPAAAAGGTERMALLSGRVTGARAGQRIVIYTKSGVWWVQPLTAQPFTTVAPDCDVAEHDSSGYGIRGACSWTPDIARRIRRTRCRRSVSGVVAIATVKGTGHFAPRPRKMLTFSGYEWDVRHIPERSRRPERLRPGQRLDRRGRAAAPEAGAARRPVDQRGSDPDARLGLRHLPLHGPRYFGSRSGGGARLLTWDDEGVDQNHRELDVEISRWGDPDPQRAVVAAAVLRAGQRRTVLCAGRDADAFVPMGARPRRVQNVRGARAAEGAQVAGHDFTSGVPTPGGERVRMNLYCFRFAPVAPQKDVEVVIERFQYVP